MSTDEMPSMDSEEIKERIYAKLSKYNDLNTLESFAMFLGVSQLLELSLKNLLVRKYDYNLDDLERHTLGMTKSELEKSGVRSDYIEFLNGVIDHRNYIAHEFLANEMILRSLLDGDAGRLEIKNLQHSIYDLEELIVLHEWCEEHDSWE